MKRAKLLWIDLEMTGLDPETDLITEVAAIATDWKFEELAVYEGIQKVDDTFMRERMVGDFWEANTESRNQLITQNGDGKPAAEIERELIDFVMAHFDTEKRIILAGNSIHQDRKFIDNEWPEFAKLLHYRMLDVSAWKIVFEGKYKKKFAKPEAHRALEDIRGSIEELQYYMQKIKANT